MSDSTTLQIVGSLLNNGVKLTDIQDILKEEHSINMTFLDLRLMAAELENVDWGKHDPKQPDPEDEVPVEVPVGDGVTTVEVSKLVRPGSVANGSVKFASGASADWLLTQQGQISLENSVGEPTSSDIEDFQVKLQEVLTSPGY